MYDEFETLQEDDGNDYYESFACTIRFNEVSLANVSSLNTWGQGYRGKELLKDAIGKFNSMNFEDVTSKHPWYLDFAKSNITMNTENPSEGGTVTCAINRDWVTTWSDFNLKAGMDLRANFGFRIYSTYGASNPSAKGFVADYSMTVLDGATHLATGMGAAFVIALLSVSAQFTF